MRTRSLLITVVLTFLAAQALAYDAIQGYPDVTPREQVVQINAALSELDIFKIHQEDTIQDLRDYTGPAAVVHIKGHTDIGDGGAGVFYKMSAGGYVDDNGVTAVPTGGNGSVAWVRDFEGFPNVRFFGAHPTRSATVNTAAIQATVDLYGINKKIYIPGNGYHINDRIHVQCAEQTGDCSFNAYGDGPYSGVIIQDDTGKDIFYIERGSGNDAGWMKGSVKNIGLLYVNGLKADTSAAIRHRRTLDFVFSDIQIEGASNVIISEGGAQAHYNRIVSHGTNRTEAANVVYTFTNNGDFNKSFGNYVTDCEHQAGVDYDVTFNLDAVDGLYVTNGHYNDSLEKILIHPKGGEYSSTVRQVFFNNVYFDGNGDPQKHIHIKSTAGAYPNTIFGLYFNNCFFRKAAQQFLFVSKTTLTGLSELHEIKVTGCEIEQVYQNIVSLVGATPGDNAEIISNVSFVGNIFRDGPPARTEPNLVGFAFEGKNIMFALNTISGNWTDAGVNVVTVANADKVRLSMNIYDTLRTNGDVNIDNGTTTDVVQN